MKNNKFKEFFRALKFTLISISAGIIQIGLFTLFNELCNWNYWAAYLTSLVASILWNFTINRKVTFKATNNVKIAMLLVFVFYLIFTPISTLLGEYAENNGANEYLVLAITMISNFVLEYLYTRFIVYRKSCDTIKKDYKKRSLLYIILRALVKFFYHKREVVGIENLPEEPSLIIGNHAQIHGPIATELYYPRKKQTWCIGQMMNKKEVQKYAFNDFWKNKPKWNRWFFKLISYIMPPFSESIFKSADALAVYKDARLFSTFKDTMKALQNGFDVVIFPENPKEYNEIVNDFQLHFVDVAKLYYGKHKKEISFVPMYHAARLHKIVIGKPIKYDHTLSIEEQRENVCKYIQDEITSLAKDLPVHKVLPYNNVGRKNYPNSK